jgi:molybdopterin-guanine dinucleotide biosynthesis protein A
MGRRLEGRDKGLVSFQGRPLVEHVIERLKSQVETVVINANRNIDSYSDYGFDVIPDRNQNYEGPLSGILAALQHCDSDYLLCVPCDAPFIPLDLVSRLSQQCDTGIEVTCAHDGDRLQPTFAMLSTALVEPLQTYLDSGQRKIDRFYESRRFFRVDFSAEPEAFANLNREEDFAGGGGGGGRLAGIFTEFS